MQTALPTTELPTVAQEERSFLCPSCRRASLRMAPHGSELTVLCSACGFGTDDLLSLIPVRAVSLVEIALGPGWRGTLRGLGFVLMLGLLVALVLWPR